jgi:ribosomal protein S18 acetylase RimI-like enzyme
MMTGLDIAIRPFEPNDASAIRALLQKIWGEDDVALSYYRFGDGRVFNRMPAAFTMVAEYQQQIVGVASAWKNSFHPNAYYFGIHVHPLYQRQGIGRALFREIEALNVHKLPMQTSLWEQSFRGIHLLRQEGFEEVRRTWMPTLSVANIDWDEYRQLEEELAGQGYRIIALGEAVEQRYGPRDIASLCAEIYQATHAVNPPAELSVEEWERIVFTDLLADGSFVAIQGDRLVAVALLHRHHERSDLVFGWRGIATQHGADHRKLILSMTLRQLEYAKHAGYDKIRAEIDSTDPWSMEMMGGFPFSAAPTWVTYRKCPKE